MNMMSKQPGTYSTLRAYLPRLASQRVSKPAKWKQGDPHPLAFLSNYGAPPDFIRDVEGLAIEFEGSVTPRFVDGIKHGYLPSDHPSAKLRARLMHRLRSKYSIRKIAEYLCASESTVATVISRFRREIGVKDE